MTSTLADDLLKSRSIQELRELVHTIQLDANSKKSELQSMVGSQYHEFIQSADRIATMEQQACQMMSMLSNLEANAQEAIKSVGQMMRGRQGRQEKAQQHMGIDISGKLCCMLHVLCMR